MDWWSKYEFLPPDWSGVAGLVAVVAALWVGTKQAQISDRVRQLQERISDSDIHMREQSLRVELLDRRSKCISEMREIVGVWSIKGKPEKPDTSKFPKLLYDAELLFPSSVVAKIDEAGEGTFWSNILAESARSLDEQGDDVQAKAKRQQSRDLEDKTWEVMRQIVKLLVEHTRVSGWPGPEKIGT